MLTLPGLIDPHVHLRTPGEEQKEDFFTGSSAALAGGFTTVIDMPNNAEPITTLERLENKEKIAQEQIVCDVGFYFGSVGDNLDQFALVQDNVLGLKIYLNQTTGGFIVDENVFRKICEAWPVGKPILVHAEEDVLGMAIATAHATGQRLHIAHVSSQEELQMVLDAKMKGYSVTCGVTPHHLFLTEENAKQLQAFGLVKPSLKSPKDQAFLWQHLKNIDVIESDHAPHTKEDKQKGAFGFPGLETTLPLLLTAVHENKLTLDDIKRLCYDNPKQIFLSSLNKSTSVNVRSETMKQSHPSVILGKHEMLTPESNQTKNRSWTSQDDASTYIEIDENEEWTIENGALFTKSNWSPFHGWKVKGKVKKVIMQDTTVFENDKIVVQSGFGNIL